MIHTESLDALTQKLLRESVLDTVSDSRVKVTDVDYSGFTEDLESKPTTMTIVCDISKL